MAVDSFREKYGELDEIYKEKSKKGHDLSEIKKIVSDAVRDYKSGDRFGAEMKLDVALNMLGPGTIEHKRSSAFSLPKGTGEKRKREEYTMLNGIVFMSFVLPAAFAMILSLPMDIFYSFVIVWVHEAGHGFWCLLGNMLLCAFGGFLNEMLFTLVPALMCFREKAIYLAGCVFIMCAGMSVYSTGVYMQSAEHPSGTSFAGALTGNYNDMNAQNHDWSFIFRELCVVEQSYKIGKFTEEFGHGISVIFFSASVLGALWMIYGRRPKKLMNFVGLGAVVSMIYFIFSSASSTEILLAMVLSMPLLIDAAARRRVRSNS